MGGLLFGVSSLQNVSLRSQHRSVKRYALSVLALLPFVLLACLAHTLRPIAVQPAGVAYLRVIVALEVPHSVVVDRAAFLRHRRHAAGCDGDMAVVQRFGVVCHRVAAQNEKM